MGTWLLESFWREYKNPDFVKPSGTLSFWKNALQAVVLAAGPWSRQGGTPWTLLRPHLSPKGPGAGSTPSWVYTCKHLF